MLLFPVSKKNKTTSASHLWTRLHSSRMHTARSLAVSPSMLCSGGGAVPGRGEGGAYLVPGGCVPGPGEGVSQHALRQTPPWTEFLTHASENITLPQTSFAGGNKTVENWFNIIKTIKTSIRKDEQKPNHVDGPLRLVSQTIYCDLSHFSACCVGGIMWKRA